MQPPTTHQRARKSLTTSFLGALLAVSACATTRLPVHFIRRAPAAAILHPQQPPQDNSEHALYGFPTYTVTRDAVRVHHAAFVLSHDAVEKVADWVAYHLTASYVRGTEKRPTTSAFKPDPALPVGQRAELVDYASDTVDYDRGHQCPNDDARARGDDVVGESFLLSNITPQAKKLNEQGWERLEEDVRRWAVQRGEVWVITGPIFNGGPEHAHHTHKQLGPDAVAVPDSYFKVVVACEGQHLTALAFIIPNAPLSKRADFTMFLRSIDDIEAMTGLDLLPEVDPDEERRVEAHAATELWPLP